MTVERLVPEHVVARRRLALENERILDAAEELAFTAGLISEDDRNRRRILKKNSAKRPKVRRAKRRGNSKVKGTG